MNDGSSLLFAGLLLLVSALPTLGCDDECASSDEAVIELGQGVGGAFLPLEDGQVVGLDVAPQGGFGVQTLVATTGLIAGDTKLADVQLDVHIEGAIAGSFLLEDGRLLCRGALEGGLVSEVVVGFDQDVYSSEDDLLSLHDQVVELDVTVTDEEGNSANVILPVTINAGG